MSDVLHIEIVQRRHRFVWNCKMFLRFFALYVLEVIFVFSLVVGIEMKRSSTSGEWCPYYIRNDCDKFQRFCAKWTYRIHYVLRIKQWRWGKGNKWHSWENEI